MRLSQLKIIIVTMALDEVPTNGKRYIAQSNDYPVRNGSGHSVDEAVEDLFLTILVHLHNIRTGRSGH